MTHDAMTMMVATIDVRDVDRDSIHATIEARGFEHTIIFATIDVRDFDRDEKQHRSMSPASIVRP